MNRQAVRIEICGPIASGKTTLADALGDRGLACTHERFDENPFFASFYANPAAYAFEAEITYLLQHYSQIHKSRATGPLVTDFSLVLDLAYAYVTLQKEDHGAFEAVFDRAVGKVGAPTLLVRLLCSSSVELHRIRLRQREVEQSISTKYLDTLDAAIGRALDTRWFRDVPAISIDSESADFRPGGGDRVRVCDRILAAFDSATANLD